MSALCKSIAVLLTINACLINNNIIASNLKNINNKDIITNDLFFNTNNQSETTNNSNELNINAKEYIPSKNRLLNNATNNNNIYNQYNTLHSAHFMFNSNSCYNNQNNINYYNINNHNFNLNSSNNYNNLNNFNYHIINTNTRYINNYYSNILPNNNFQKFNIINNNVKALYYNNAINTINNDSSNTQTNSSTDSTSSNKNNKDIITENKNTINITNKLLENTNNNQIKKEDEKVIDYNNPVLIENNKNLLNEVAENIDNNDLDEAKNKLEEFLNNIKHVEINDISDTDLKTWIEKATPRLTDPKYNEYVKKLKSFGQNKHYKDQIKSFNEEIYQPIIKLRKNILENLNDSKTNYKFYKNTRLGQFGPRRQENNAKHLLLRTHIFQDIGKKDTSGKENDQPINGVESMLYYNELHQIMQKLMTIKNSTDKEVINNLAYNILNYCLVNPLVNKLLNDIKESKEFIADIRLVNNNEENLAMLSVVNAKDNNELRLYVTNYNNIIENGFATFFGNTELQYLNKKYRDSILHNNNYIVKE